MGLQRLSVVCQNQSVGQVIPPGQVPLGGLDPQLLSQQDEERSCHLVDQLERAERTEARPNKSSTHHWLLLQLPVFLMHFICWAFHEYPSPQSRSHTSLGGMQLVLSFAVLPVCLCERGLTTSRSCAPTSRWGR